MRLCLNAFRLVVFFISSGVLFRNAGPMKDKRFSPLLVLRKKIVEVNGRYFLMTVYYRPYSQMHGTDNYSQHRSIIWPV